MTEANVFDQIFTAVHSSNWKLVAALAVIALVQVMKTKGSSLFPILAKGWAAFVTALVLGAAGAVATAYAASEAITGKLVLEGIEIGFLAAGGWSGFKALIEAKKAADAKTPPPTPPSA